MSKTGDEFEGFDSELPPESEDSDALVEEKSALTKRRQIEAKLEEKRLEKLIDDYAAYDEKALRDAPRRK